MSDPKLKQVVWKKETFELGYNMNRFISEFLGRNSARVPAPTRQDINLHWTWQVMHAYPNGGDPKRNHLLDQITCPLVQSLWEKRQDEEALERKREKQREDGFYIANRATTEREQREYPFAAIMTHWAIGDIIIPDLLLQPLHKISYLELVPKIRAANPSKNLESSVLRVLWEALLSKVYDFEYDWREDKKWEASRANFADYRKQFEPGSQSKKRKLSDFEEKESSELEALLSFPKTQASAKTRQIPEVLADSMTEASSEASNSPKALGTLDVGPSNGKGETRAKAGNILEASSISDVGRSNQMGSPPTKRTAPRPKKVPSQTQAPLKRIPAAMRQSNAVPVQAVTKISASQPPSIRSRPAQAPTANPPLIPSTTNNSTPPWPYNPDTGERTSRQTPYILSDREDLMLDNGIAPWKYDPRTGVKTGDPMTRFKRRAV